MENTQNKNRLIHEKSPYLLQHAGNPVDWYPWGAEAFEKAARENKPIFLSIGYSTCHWCHVMAHESFEDPRVAELINDVFVPVKVDREERPDVDMVYMTVCQMMTGSGGWPLTIIMTPDKRPFFAATYIPRETRFGRVGMLELIPRIREVWTKRKDEVLSSAGQVVAALQEAAGPAAGESPGVSMLHLAYEQLRERFDEKHGGFGGAPKFPTLHNLLFLLRYWKRTGDGKALDMVEKTLRAMRRGGIYDHIGYGFHRYSTDARWLVPHFEKMLYDQALLATAYIEVFQATRKEEYGHTAREIFTYVLRDMTSREGGFYSAEDADSEGEEGKFYLWTPEEIKQVLPAEEAELFIKFFNIEEGGNFRDEAAGTETGTNIPHLAESPEATTSEINASGEFQQSLESIREKLFNIRDKRVHPHKDDKILTDWNGLMIAAMAKGARVLNQAEYAGAAKRAADFLLGNLATPDGRLFHRYRDGEAAVPGHLDDYAFLIYGLLELYETTFEPGYLKKALKLQEYLLSNFWDDKNGGFYFTARDGEALLVRQKEIYDGAIPSGNSIAMMNLLRLGRITANHDFEEKAAAIGRAFFESIKQLPSAYTQFMAAVDFAVGPSYEVIITGDPKADDTGKMLQTIRQEFIPNKIVIFLPATTNESDIRRIAPFTADMAPIDGKATAYVCADYKCNLPATDADTFLSLLRSA